MPKEQKFSISIFVEISCYEKKILTCVQIDTGVEVSLGKEFLFNNWINNPIRISMQVVTGEKYVLDKVCLKPEIIIGSKIVAIRQLHAYNKLDVDLLLGNDFIQQF